MKTLGQAPSDPSSRLRFLGEHCPAAQKQRGQGTSEGLFFASDSDKGSDGDSDSDKRSDGDSDGDSDISANGLGA